MNKLSRLLAFIVLVVSMVLAGGGPATAEPAAGPKTCVVALDALQPGQVTSTITSDRCTSDPAELRQLMRGSTTLMKLYVTADYQSGPVNFVGNDGTCDTAGYGIRNLGDYYNETINDAVSSFKVYGACNEVGLYEHEHYNLFTRGRSQFYRGSQRYVGGYMNDRTTSLVVYHAK